MKLIFIIILILIYIKYLKIELDKTEEGDFLIWYGRKQRKYIILWKKEY